MFSMILIRSSKMKHVILLMLVSTVASTAEFCVTDGGGLLSAINTADGNNQADHIKLAEGNYSTPPGGFIFQSSQDDDLEISGGWTSFMGNPCGQQLGGSPFNTTLDADSQGRVMRILPGAQADVTLSGMSFINGFLTGAGNNGGSLLINTGVGSTSKVVVERMAFVNNNGFGAGAVMIQNADEIVFRNNLVLANTSESGSAVVNLTVPTDHYGIFAINNTFHSNSGGLYLNVSGGSQSLVVNNLLWNNNQSDLRMTGNGYKRVWNNNLEQLVTDQQAVWPDEYTGNWSIQPLFESGILNFTPSVNSPVVGFGRKPPFIVPIPTPFQYDWYVGEIDFAGNLRESGNRVDIGAHESPHQEIIELPLFYSGFND
jgi:hypothetical protein